MNPNIKRQIKDIQYRAESLINSKPSLVDIEEFDKYNEELKAFLLNNLSDKELLDRVVQIPRVLDESNSQVAVRGVLEAFLAIFTAALAPYFRDRQKRENARDQIREAQGKYASIEFLLGNLD